jgi:hypothetical protein
LVLLAALALALAPLTAAGAQAQPIDELTARSR